MRGSYSSDFIIGHFQNIFHDLINFTNQLHITILNPIMNHLDEMTRTGWTNLWFQWKIPFSDKCPSEEKLFTQSQHGCPSAFAAIFWNIGLTCSLEWIFNIDCIRQIVIVLPCFFTPTWHQWWTRTSTFFSTWYTSTNIEKTFLFQFFCTSLKSTKSIRIFPKRCR